MKIGDLVSVVDDDLKGTIVSVKKNTVTFEDEHGFHYSFDKSQLVLQVQEIYMASPPVEKSEPQKISSKKHKNQPELIDLHFENLVPEPQNYVPAERLLIQKEALLKKLEYCRSNNLKKLRIVHGIGDGVLQNMVHEILAGQMHLEFDDHRFFYHQTGSLLVTFR